MWTNSINLIESHHLVVVVDHREVEKSWVERVLSSEPWRATKFVPVRGPDPNLYRINSTTYVGHPVTVNQLRRRIREAESQLVLAL